MDTARLIFEWSSRHRLSATFLGFLVLSFAAHLFGFYLFQVVYPPAISITAPAAEITLLTPSTAENKELLARIGAEDPAKLLMPPDILPPGLLDLPYKPSYAESQPEPASAPESEAPIAYPPVLDANALVRAALPRRKPNEMTVGPSKTRLVFSGEIKARELRKLPALSFKIQSPQMIEPTRFLIGVDTAGAVCYSFLQASSGDEQVDREAELALRALQFSPAQKASVTWGIASFAWGSVAFTKTDEDQNP
ncbi:MAG: hypothetical protein M3O82_06490 [Verrucomicrobiota bacterium]|nr:hypothetical protein [Verrucomicrobiota bacterium]